jgi:hypothetical protein
LFGIFIFKHFSDDTEIRQFILEHISAEMFENENSKQLFNLILNELEDVGHIDVNTFLSEDNGDDKMVSRIAELVMTQESQSLKFAQDCVFQVKKWHLEKKSRELSRFIKAESDSPESMMHYTRELSKTRKELSELEKAMRGIKDKTL